MEHDVVLAHLDAFLDGELPEGERREVELHLRGCVPCAQEAAAMRRLLERTRELPRSLPPDRDLWPGVRARLPRQATRAPRARVSSWWRPALAAAAVLAVALVGIRLATRTESVGGRAQPGASALPASTASVLAALDQETAAMGRSLGAAMDAGGSLGPEEGAAINEGLNSLAIAIAQTRMALAQDPDNPELLLRLTSYYRERLVLLEKATKLLRA